MYVGRMRGGGRGGGDLSEPRVVLALGEWQKEDIKNNLIFNFYFKKMIKS